MADNHRFGLLGAREAGDGLCVRGVAPTFEDAQRNGQASLGSRDRYADAPFPHVQSQDASHAVRYSQPVALRFGRVGTL